MTYIEMLNALNEGKKIRHKKWKGYRYIHLVKDELMNQNNVKFTLETTIHTRAFSTRDDWEIYPEPILDAKEKAYLEAVVRPFKDRVSYITKTNGARGECLSISIHDDSIMWFPYFKAGTMYKGMKTHESYSLKELGLFQE